jgi:response regulator RpfG family c-di-GMP phosphodiesterase
MAEQPIHPTVLIIEDEAGPRNALSVILRPFCTVLTAAHGHAALEALAAHPVDLVTLDLKLPDRSGLDLLRDLRMIRPEVEVIIITGFGSLSSAVSAFQLGAASYLLKPFNVAELVAIMHQTIAKKRRLDVLRHYLAHSGAQLAAEGRAELAWSHLLNQHHRLVSAEERDVVPASGSPDYTGLLAEVLEARSRALFAHSCRVGYYAHVVAQRMTLSPSERRTLALGAFLHDVGVAALPLRLSPSPWAFEEWEDWSNGHHELGARIAMATRLGPEVAEVIRSHHERFDGAGPTHSLQGDWAAPLARTVGVLEFLDQLVVVHPDGAEAGFHGAVEEIKAQAGRRFDPAVVETVTQALVGYGPTCSTQAASVRTATLSS